MKDRYTDTAAEYEALRGGTGLIEYEGVGLFAVSGPGAPAFLGRVCTRAVDFLLDGRIAVALMLRPDGTVVAETLLHCRGDGYLLQVWPAQADAAREHLLAAVEDEDVTLTDASDDFRVFGIEGPASFRIAQEFLPFPVASMAYRTFTETEHDGAPLLISRSGVTGEYGYLLHVPADRADDVRERLVKLGAVSCGLDAVDTCRMETRFANLEKESAGERVTPFDLGIQWMVDADQDFVGAEAFRAAGADPQRRPVCWTAEGSVAEPPASGTPLTVEDQKIGVVTHAVRSPKLGRVIGTAWVDPAVAASGQEYRLDGTSVRTISAPFLVATSFGVSMD